MIRLVALGLVVALLSPQLAFGAPDGSATIARERAKRGYALYAIGKYLEAATQFEEAYTARPEAGLLYNAAQSARLGGDLRKAQTLYSSYVSFHPDGPNFGEAKEHLEKLATAIKADEAARVVTPTATTPATATTAPSPTIDHAPAAEPRSPPPRRADRPLLKRWWLWTAVGGGVVVLATAITLGVVLTRPAPAWSNVRDLGPGVGPAGAAPGLLVVHF